MKLIKAALLALAMALVLSGPAFAQPYVDESRIEYTYTNPETGAHLVLHGTACKDPAVLQYIFPKFWKDFRAATATWNGKKFSLCYDATDMDEEVHVISPDGGEVYLPRSLFTRLLGT